MRSREVPAIVAPSADAASSPASGSSGARPGDADGLRPSAPSSGTRVAAPVPTVETGGERSASVAAGGAGGPPERAGPGPGVVARSAASPIGAGPPGLAAVPTVGAAATDEGEAVTPPSAAAAWGEDGAVAAGAPRPGPARSNDGPNGDAPGEVRPADEAGTVAEPSVAAPGVETGDAEGEVLDVAARGEAASPLRSDEGGGEPLDPVAAATDVLSGDEVPVEAEPPGDADGRAPDPSPGPVAVDRLCATPRDAAEPGAAARSPPGGVADGSRPDGRAPPVSATVPAPPPPVGPEPAPCPGPVPVVVGIEAGGRDADAPP